MVGLFLVPGLDVGGNVTRTRYSPEQQACLCRNLALSAIQGRVPVRV